MSDYTPTTEDIRNAYMSGDWNDNPTDDDAMKRHFAAKFDRWLAAHDAKTYQRGREEAAAALTDYFWPIDGSWITPETSFDVIGNGAIAAARGDGEQA